MATLAQIRQRVSRKLQDDSNTAESVSVVDSEINRSIRFYRNDRFWFNEELAELSLTDGDKVVPNIPSDLVSELQVNGILLIDDQVKINLQKLSPENFFNRDDDQTGRPYFYTYRNGQFLVLPTPNENYPVIFRYLKSYPELVGDDATNDFTENAEDLITLHTLKNMYAEDKQDTQLAAFYQQLEDQELGQLRERTNNLNKSGRLTTTAILERNTFY